MRAVKSLLFLFCCAACCCAQTESLTIGPGRPAARKGSGSAGARAKRASDRRGYASL